MSFIENLENIFTHLHELNQFKLTESMKLGNIHYTFEFIANPYNKPYSNLDTDNSKKIIRKLCNTIKTGISINTTYAFDLFNKTQYDYQKTDIKTWLVKIILDHKPSIDELKNLYQHVFYHSGNSLDVFLPLISIDNSQALDLFSLGHDYDCDSDLLKYTCGQSPFNNFISHFKNRDISDNEMIEAIRQHVKNSHRFNMTGNDNTLIDALSASIKDQEKCYAMIYELTGQNLSNLNSYENNTYPVAQFKIQDKLIKKNYNFPSSSEAKLFIEEFFSNFKNHHHSFNLKNIDIYRNSDDEIMVCMESANNSFPNVKLVQTMLDKNLNFHRKITHDNPLGYYNYLKEHPGFFDTLLLNTKLSVDLPDKLPIKKQKI